MDLSKFARFYPSLNDSFKHNLVFTHPSTKMVATKSAVYIGEY